MTPPGPERRAPAFACAMQGTRRPATYPDIRFAIRAWIGAERKPAEPRGARLRYVREALQRKAAIMQPNRVLGEAAVGGVIGAGLGAASVVALVALFGASEMLSTSRETLPWFAGVVLVIVTQFAVFGAICTLAIRQFSAPGVRPMVAAGWRPVRVAPKVIR